MSKSKKKVVFEVRKNESIGECLERIKQQGYTPIRRTEKPIFQEVIKKGKKTIEPISRQIMFEAKEIE